MQLQNFQIEIRPVLQHQNPECADVGHLWMGGIHLYCFLPQLLYPLAERTNLKIIISN